MKAALFNPCTYPGPVARPGWPAPTSTYSSDLAEETFADSLEQCRLADEVGFDWVTVAEHHYAPFCITPNPMVLAGALTQVVKRAKIALLGADIPILNPVRVAEEFAMLDTMTGGRIIAGMLRGTPNEYITYNVNPAESRDRFAEALALIRAAWTETEPFGWQGRYYQYKTISVWPRVIQAPHPPIYMSGSSPESGEFAARNRVGLGLAVTTLPLAAKAAQHFRDQAHLAGWEPTPDDIVYRLACYVADTDDEAMADMAEFTHTASAGASLVLARDTESSIASAGYYGRDEAQRTRTVLARAPEIRDRIELGQLLLGSPATVTGQIRRIREAIGAGVLDLVPRPAEGAKALRSIELFGTKVLPAIRDL
jgi:alkanesulfonate monooxygenase SsuD/methylene tetrahydromethanopterin reductase-like flavin-dependent oxidoreductase (luciferase family)